EVSEHLLIGVLLLLGAVRRGKHGERAAVGFATSGAARGEACGDCYRPGQRYAALDSCLPSHNFFLHCWAGEAGLRDAGTPVLPVLFFLVAAAGAAED